MRAAIFAAALGLAMAGCNDAPPGPEDVRVISSFGRQPGQVTKPRAVAVNGAGELVVIDRSGRIQIFDVESGDFLRKWQLDDYTNGTPTGVCLDPLDGSLWVADTHYQRILKYNLDGTLALSFGEHGEAPGQFVFPTDLAVSNDGKLLHVTEYGRRNRLMTFTREGKFVREWGAELFDTTDMDRPMAIAVGPDGRLFVADAGNHSILVFSPEGEFLHRWGEPGPEPGQLKYPYDIALDAKGRLYVCEYGNNRVSLFEPDGRFAGSWGGPGHSPGQFFMPWGVTVSERGRVVVADTNNGRVQVLDDSKGAFAVAQGGGI